MAIVERNATCGGGTVIPNKTQEQRKKGRREEEEGLLISNWGRGRGREAGRQALNKAACLQTAVDLKTSRRRWDFLLVGSRTGKQDGEPKMAANPMALSMALSTLGRRTCLAKRQIIQNTPTRVLTAAKQTA